MADPSCGGAVTFTVTRTDDQLDSSPGDGLCSALNGGGCSLRAAVQEANALSGADGIYLPPGTYSLTLAGAGEDFAASGDLDITSAIAILGTGWAVTSIEMQSFGDRIFDIQGFSGLGLGDVTISGGLAAGVGGGIYVRTGGGLAIRRSRIQWCAAHHGGAIGTVGGSVMIEDTGFAHDYAFANPPQATVTVRPEARTQPVRRLRLGGRNRRLEQHAVDRELLLVGRRQRGTHDLHQWSEQRSDRRLLHDRPNDGRRLRAPRSEPVARLFRRRVLHANGGKRHLLEQRDERFFDGTACVGINDVDGDWSLYPLWAPPDKFPARVPNSYSAALEGGHPFVCAPADQSSQALRPFDSDGDGTPVLEVGAVEAIIVIFLDGFEIGSTAFWSARFRRAIMRRTALAVFSALLLWSLPGAAQPPTCATNYLGNGDLDADDSVWASFFPALEFGWNSGFDSDNNVCSGSLGVSFRRLCRSARWAVSA